MPHISCIDSFCIIGHRLAQAAQGSGGVTVPGGVQELVGWEVKGPSFSGHCGHGSVVGLENLCCLFQL